jgi:SAM-dependent methyltransferase
VAVPAGLGAAVAGVSLLSVIAALWIGAVGAVLLSKRPARFAATVGALLLVGAFAAEPLDTVWRDRSFFGVSRVKRDSEGHHILLHGTTVHGAQKEGSGEPLTYYTRQGPLGRFFENARTPRVAVLGLGTGTLAAYARAGDEWTFYEIDPAVVRIARDRRFFTYLSDCAARVEVVPGDARISLARAPAGHYSLIVLDVFSSDAIPVHLLTREAMRLYVSKLAPDGILLMNVASRYLDLRPVVAALAEDAGLRATLLRDVPSSRPWRTRTRWVALSRAGTAFDGEPLVRAAGAPLWTDNYSNVLGVIEWR